MLSGLGALDIALLMAGGVLLDALLGEARRWHPLVGFGRLASALEKMLNRRGGYAHGVLGWLLAVVPLTALAWLLADRGGYAVHALLLYLCIGLRSLRDHNIPIAEALARGDLPQARWLTSRIVSRDTSAASEADLAKASTESLLENGNDAVFGTLFWFAVAGGPGAILFRLANTLDAMWGYRNARFLRYGWAAARIDDVLNLLPARLTALSYVLLAPTLDGKRRAWRCWRVQAPAWSSPNAGPVMSSGAGALGLSLGGAAVYDGEVEQRPPLGMGQPACTADIVRAWALVRNTTLLWLAIAATIALGARYA
ncbi:adenosylcobinamide-phosphate synthase CbiB [Pseudoduganella ginsengisoli]|uniref:Cobalamin biosynthesis protein CobD n=1 Tax=Pseudoduganella ginsengisoli TaxID=1462440 RepID=A0A6L6Q8N0_9BURK|nr:adenosylcobinamide-phosphate synthase CbiB [Pseudoduganella ginsengisoli]MTW06243.1 cobalamin biosynthesis protein [Pseudoduganella ginsengisoli]